MPFFPDIKTVEDYAPQGRASPFWSYFGSKWNAAKYYPFPLYDTIIEPFAGGAGYSLNYPAAKVLLFDKYAVLKALWNYLIVATASDILNIPIVKSIHDLPNNLNIGARHLVGFNLNSAVTRPGNTLNTRNKNHQDKMIAIGWGSLKRQKISLDIHKIDHWLFFSGRSYENLPDIEATWFIDPPYNNAAGKNYKHHDINYNQLAEWCRSRKGQVIVCENLGASWLPFRPHLSISCGGVPGTRSQEVIWTNE